MAAQHGSRTAESGSIRIKGRASLGRAARVLAPLRAAPQLRSYSPIEPGGLSSALGGALSARGVPVIAQRAPTSANRHLDFAGLLGGSPPSARHRQGLRPRTPGLGPRMAGGGSGGHPLASSPQGVAPATAPPSRPLDGCHRQHCGQTCRRDGMTTRSRADPGRRIRSRARYLALCLKNRPLSHS